MNRYIVLDFETYPIDGKSFLMEVGCCEVINGKIGRSWQTYIRPITTVSDFVLNLTGINQKDLDTAPEFNTILEEFYDFISDDIIVAHNAFLDKKSFEMHCTYNKIKPKSFHWVDSQDIIKIAIPTTQTLQLQALLEQYGFEQKVSHRALEDAKGLANFLCHINKKIEINLSKKDLRFLKSSDQIEINILYKWAIHYLTFTTQETLPHQQIKTLPNPLDSNSEECKIVHYDLNNKQLCTHLVNTKQKQLIITKQKSFDQFQYIPNFKQLAPVNSIQRLRCILSNSQCSHMEFIDILSIIHWLNQTKTFNIIELNEQLRQRYRQISDNALNIFEKKSAQVISAQLLTKLDQEHIIECDYTSFYLLSKYQPHLINNYCITFHNFFDLDQAFNQFSKIEFSSLEIKKMNKRIIMMSFWIQYIKHIGENETKFLKDFARLKNLSNLIEDEKRQILENLNSLVKSLSINIYDFSTREVLINEFVLESMEWQAIQHSLNNTIKHIDDINLIFQNIKQYITNDLIEWVNDLIHYFLNLKNNSQSFINSAKDSKHILVESYIKNKPSNCKLISTYSFMYVYYKFLQENMNYINIHQYTNQQSILKSYIEILFGNYANKIDILAENQHNKFKHTSVEFRSPNTFYKSLKNITKKNTILLIFLSVNRIKFWKKEIRKQCSIKKLEIDFNKISFLTINEISKTKNMNANRIIFPEFLVPNVIRPLHLSRLNQYKIDERTYINQLFLQQYISVSEQLMHHKFKSLTIHISPEFKSLIDTFRIK